MRLAEFRKDELSKELGVDVSFSAFIGRIFTQHLKEVEPELYTLWEKSRHDPAAQREIEAYLQKHNFALQETDKHFIPSTREERKIKSYRAEQKKRRAKAKARKSGSSRYEL